MDERDQKAINDETRSFNYEPGIYEPTCRLRINMCVSPYGRSERLQQMYINKSNGKTYWSDVEIGYFQD